MESVLTEPFTKAVDTITQAWSAVATTVDETVSKIEASAQRATDAIQALLDKAQQAATAIPSPGPAAPGVSQAALQPPAISAPAASATPLPDLSAPLQALVTDLQIVSGGLQTLVIDLQGLSTNGIAALATALTTVSDPLTQLGQALTSATSNLTAFSNAASPLAQQLDAVSTAAGGLASALSEAASAARAGGGSGGSSSEAPPFARGGQVFGTPGIDQIPAWLTNLEFVMKPEAVRYYGADFMHRINQMRLPKDIHWPRLTLPKFNAGGLVQHVVTQILPRFSTGTQAAAPQIVHAAPDVLVKSALERVTSTVHTVHQTMAKVMVQVMRAVTSRTDATHATATNTSTHTNTFTHLLSPVTAAASAAISQIGDEIEDAVRRATAALRTVSGTATQRDAAVGSKFATGGQVIGTQGIDKIPAWLSHLEFVMRPEAVRFYGVDFMHRLNQMRLPKVQWPKFQLGGLVHSVTSNVQRFATGGLVAAGGIGPSVNLDVLAGPLHQIVNILGTANRQAISHDQMVQIVGSQPAPIASPVLPPVSPPEMPSINLLNDSVTVIKSTFDGLRIPAQDLSVTLGNASVPLQQFGGGLSSLTSAITTVVQNFGASNSALSTFATAITQIASAAVAGVSGSSDGSNGSSVGTGFAVGGPVFGTPGIDKIPAWLTHLEFVMRPEAVRFYGADFMHRLNQLQLPKFGGFPGFNLGGLADRFTHGLDLPHFATGGLAAAGAVSGGGSSGHASRNLTLVLNGHSFGLTGQEHVISALERHVVTSKISSTGSKPGWVR